MQWFQQYIRCFRSCIYMSTYHVAIALVGQACGKLPRSLFTSQGANISIVPRSRLPTHSNYFPLQCQTHYTVLQPTLCAVDVHEHESLSCYHSSCQPSFWKFPRFLIAFRGATHRSVQWLRLWTHLRWILNQCQTYKRCFTTFISSGCAYVIAHTVLPLLSSSKLLEGTTLNSGYIPRGKPQSSSV
jgi:hypothetical protein